MIHSYKKYISFNIFILLINLCQAQTPQITYELQSNESGTTKTYIARDQIVLKPGFKFESPSTNTFNAKIDAGLLFPPTENTYALPNGNITTDPTLGAVVGSIPGQFAVSPSGAATYTIPIECPSGINGMQPNVSLVYNSQGGNGIAGWGWNIGGVSMISRVAKNHYYDGEKTGIIWDNTSPYALDGQRLLVIQSWGTDSVEYDTESQSGNRIVGYDIQSWGPRFFKIYTKSGQIITYGNPDNLSSYFPLSGYPIVPVNIPNRFRNIGWGIVSILDRNFNTINFYYKNEEQTDSRGSLYVDNRLDSISYGGNILANKDNDLSVTFDYNDISPNLVVETFIDGSITTTKKILSKISTYSCGVLHRTYENHYSVSDDKYKLTNIEIANSNNEKLISPEYEWSENVYQLSFQGTIIRNPLTSPLIYQLYHQSGYNDIDFFGQSWGDFDGDGDLDILVKNKLTKMYYENGWDEFWGIKSYDYKYVWVLYENINGNHVFFYDEIYDDTSNTYFVLLDRDNDNRDEIYIGGPKEYENRVDNGDGTYTTSRAIEFEMICYEYENQAIVRSYSNDFKMPLEDYYTNNISVVPADFLGKGEPQFMGFIYDEEGAFKLVDFSEADIDVENIVDAYDRYDIYIADFNGNGKSELVYVHDDIRFYEFESEYVYGRDGYEKVNKLNLIYTLNGFNYFDEIYSGDFNGDGNTDLLIHDYPSYTWRFFMSTGNNLVETEMTNTLTYYSRIKVIDVNKDGKSDLLFLDFIDGQHYFKLLVSDGNNFEQKFSVLSPPPVTNVFDVTGIVTGDNFEDIVISALQESFILGVSNDIKFNKIIEFSDPYSKITSAINYDTYNSNIYKAFENGISDDVENSQRNVSSKALGNWDVVNESFVTDSLENEISRTRYYYGNAIIHKEGKGFLGYDSIAKLNTVNSIYEITKNKFVDSLFILLPEMSATLKYNTGDTLSKSISSYSFQARSGIPQSYSLKLDKQVSKDYLSNLETKVEYLAYDNWLNPIQIKTTKGDLVETQVITPIQKGSWCPNKPQDISVVTTYDGQTETKQKSFNYDNKGNLTQEIVNPNNAAYKITTEYKDFNLFGQAQTVEVKANDALGAEQTRSSSIRYTPSGKFVSSKTNVFGETTTYNWDETRGLLMSETTRGKTTDYSYDSFGRLKETKYPDGNRTTQVLQWASQGNVIGAKYYSFAQTSGSAPVTVWYDALGREIRKDTYGLDSLLISISTEYYESGTNKGRLYRVSEPYFEEDASSKTWARTFSEYDPYGRVKTVATPMGNVTTTYSGLSTTVTTPEGTKTTTLNSSGLMTSSTVNGKTVSYTYYPSGLTKTATPHGGQALAMEYNLQGKRTKLTDPDAGVIETRYNGFGELVEEKQKVHNDNFITTINNLEPTTGRLSSIVRNGETTTYVYDSINRLISINIPGHEQIFSYDEFDRVTNIKEEIGSKIFNRATEYDALGRILKETYPSGYYTFNSYDNDYGYLKEVKDANGKLLWKAVSENARGQLTQVQRGDITTTYGFDSNGLPTSIQAPGILKLRYSFENNGNLAFRQDSLGSQYIQKEVFQYDELNRLTNWNVYQNEAIQKSDGMVYNPTTGTITSKSDLDNLTMLYGDNGKPHALTGIDGVPSVFPTDSLNVSYTDFKKIKTLTEGNKQYVLTYGVDDQRRKSEYTINGVTQSTRYYLGDYEEVTDNVGNIKKIHYLSGGAILINTNGVETLYYGYYDYQGSLIALANDTGTVVERYAYDPWGKRRNPADWTEDDSRTSWTLNRGYTMHEHLDAFNIINMNGRVYDPLTAMFFSPDPFVQAPGNWLNYNRYGYAFGNPFKYTDPDGENPLVIIALTLLGGYIGGIATNQGELNPGEWDWNNPGTYFGIGFGMFMGYAGGYWLYNPSALNASFGLSLDSQWGSAVIGIGGVSTTGGMSNWNFYWSTSAGGGGEVPLGERKSANEVVQNSVNSGIAAYTRAINNQYYSPAGTLTYSEARDFAVRWSKDINKEVMLYYTSKGWYMEKTEGWSFGNTLMGTDLYGGYFSNTIKNAYPYTLYPSNQVRPSNNPGSWSTLYWAAHTHPSNSGPSTADMIFSQTIQRPLYVWGWSGNKNDYIIHGDYYQKVSMYLKYGFIPPNY